MIKYNCYIGYGLDDNGEGKHRINCTDEERSIARRIDKLIRALVRAESLWNSNERHLLLFKDPLLRLGSSQGADKVIEGLESEGVRLGEEIKATKIRIHKVVFGALRKGKRGG